MGETFDGHDPLKEGGSKAIIKAGGAEESLMDILHRPGVREELKERMRQIVKKELVTLSDGIKESLAQWVAEEKRKAIQLNQAQQLLSENVEEIKHENAGLNDENDSLKRKLELKGHENKMMLDSLKQMLSKPVKK